MKKAIWSVMIAALFAVAAIGLWTTSGPTATAADLPAPVAPQSNAANQFIIADHTIVDRYNDIPQYWIDEVKKMWVDIPGESHASGYRNGLEASCKTWMHAFRSAPSTMHTGRLYTAAFACQRRHVGGRESCLWLAI